MSSRVSKPGWYSVVSRLNYWHSVSSLWSPSERNLKLVLKHPVCAMFSLRVFVAQHLFKVKTLTAKLWFTVSHMEDSKVHCEIKA